MNLPRSDANIDLARASLRVYFTLKSPVNPSQDAQQRMEERPLGCVAASANIRRPRAKLLVLQSLGAYGRGAPVDADSCPVYHDLASGRSGDRGLPCWEIEESPYSIGRGAGEIPGRSNLSDRATEKNSRSGPLGLPGDGEKAA